MILADVFFLLMVLDHMEDLLLSLTFLRQITEDCIRRSCHHSKRNFMQSYTG